MSSRVFSVCSVLAVILATPLDAAGQPCDVSGPDLVVDGTACTLSGVHAFDDVRVINGGTIRVTPYAGGDAQLTGNLELRASSIFVDVNSTITARGAGYSALRCGNGRGPTGSAGGRGGCSVRDSGGGGAHFGGGGRGTKDCDNGTCGSNPSTCEFPQEFEEACGSNLNAGGTACVTTGTCWTCDALPTGAGQTFWHSIYDPEFGAAGGDKGCYDADGFGTQPNVSGSGGGRVVLAGLDGGMTGAITINGTIDADGRRGCGIGNDSAGGGAGGTVFLVGQDVSIGPAARISAAGGLGGDTRGVDDPTGDCVLPAQQTGTCDDCGGGGGGGIINVQSITASISDRAEFHVNGGLGGTCALCQGEAGGGAGELQIAGAFVGELCDDEDNDFDDSIDEGFPVLDCDGSSVLSCGPGGVPQECPPELPECVGPVTDTRARFMVIVDSSGSMLNDLAGDPTFGDGSAGHQGLDRDGSGAADDSRLFLAKEALTTVIAAYPEIDFALGRYHQDESLDRSCQLAHWFECGTLCCSYDDPSNNTGPLASPSCQVDGGAAGVIPVREDSPGDECINYAGTCGPPRRGADVLVGFGADINEYLMWMDHQETSFDPSTTTGAYCDFPGGGDCELRGTGPTPLGNSLEAAHDYLQPIVTCDAASTGGCRTTGVILLTDGAESCQGDPIGAAAALLADVGVETYVVGFSVEPGEIAELHAIAGAGSVSGNRPAFLVGDEDELENALATIVSDSIVFELCNGDDDDCDGATDEDFPDLGQACDDGQSGACRDTGLVECNGSLDGTQCQIPPGSDDDDPVGADEVCNGLDDDCDTLIDEGLSCESSCTPTGPDLCDGLDNDCDGSLDEDDPAEGMECGATDVGECELGQWVCIAGDLVCVGEVGPGAEVCNGLDDDCDGAGDDEAPCPEDQACLNGACRLECTGDEFPCPFGFECVMVDEGNFCVPSACAECAAEEVCDDNQCVDPCADVECEANESCEFGSCVDCHLTGCPDGQVCAPDLCVDHPCRDVECGDDASCVEGTCVPDCDDSSCPAGQACGPEGTCQEDACAGLTCHVSEVCLDGECVLDPCRGVRCDPGFVCARGECVGDPCQLTECSPGRTCEATPEGEARCVDDGDGGIQFVFAGGSGCGCQAGGGGQGAAWLVLFALVVAFRRRRQS